MSTRPKNSVMLVSLLLGAAAMLSMAGVTEPPAMPESRSFRMGFTPHPYDYTPEAVQKTYEHINRHSDIVCHHFDGGVPWPEALVDEGYSAHFQGEIKTRLARREEGQAIYLSCTPIRFMRDGLAGYWGEKENMPLPGGWEDKTFDDPDVIKAYTNYCRRLIEHFEPAFMAYGIEVNILAQKKPKLFQKYLTLVRSVYKNLKAAYPDLPLIQSIQLSTFQEDTKAQTEAVKHLLPYTDCIAVSLYPYGNWPNPKDIPDHYLSDVCGLAPDKPFAVAETGFLAEDLEYEKQGVVVKACEAWQADYVDFILRETHRRQGKFVIWFVPWDYDAGWERLKAMGFDELFKVWRDAGLVDGNGSPRPALKRWDAWRALPRR